MEKVLPAEPVLSLLLAVLSTSDCTCKTRALLLKCKTDLQTRSYIEELISQIHFQVMMFHCIQIACCFKLEIQRLLVSA